MPIAINTARGIYSIVNARPPERDASSIVLTLSLERADGIEKVALRVRISNALASSHSPEQLIERLAPRLEREFEQTREAALKSIRTERRLLELTFDASSPGFF